MRKATIGVLSSVGNQYLTLNDEDGVLKKVIHMVSDVIAPDSHVCTSYETFSEANETYDILSVDFINKGGWYVV